MPTPPPSGRYSQESYRGINETLARAKKWSADIREAASNFADSVLRNADKALVMSINEVRDARQKVSDTYKGDKNAR